MKKLALNLGLGLAGVAAVAIIFVAEKGAADSPKDLRLIMMERLREAPAGSTIQFREGDVLPFQMRFSGDLLESQAVTTSQVTVKKTFWVRADDQQILLSFDGEHFRPANQVITGSIQVGSGGGDTGGVANGIFGEFNAVLK